MPFRKKLLIGAGVVFALGVCGYFVATSSAFFKAFILPRVGATLGATLTVESASLSPFSRVILRGLKVQTTGSEPLLSADEVRLRYSLLRILRGTIAVDELKLIGPSVTLVQAADGTSNLDPILKALASGPEKTAKPKKPQPVVLAIRDIALQRASVRVVQEFKGGRTLLAMAPVEVSVDRLVSGEPGKVTVGLGLNYEAGLTNTLQARGEGTFTVTLSPDLLPDVKGRLRFEVSQANGVFREAGQLAFNLDCDLSTTDLRNLSVRFEQGGKSLGQVRVSGPLELAKSEGRLKLDVTAIDRQVLNLVGAPLGIDFAGTTITSTNLVDIAQKGGVIAAKGQVTGRNVSLKRDLLTTPVLAMDVDYQVTVNLAEKSAVIQKLAMLARQANEDVLRAGLDRPMNVSWGENATGFKESAFQLQVNRLNLADWQPILGRLLPAGRIDLQLGVVALEDGKNLKLDLNTRATDVTAMVGTNRIDQAGLTLKMNGQVQDFRSVAIDSYVLTLSRANATLLTASGKASYDLKENLPDVQVTLETSLPGLMPFVPIPNVVINSGAARLNALFSPKTGQTNISGTLVITELTGRVADYVLANWQLNAEWDWEARSGLWTFNRTGVALRQGLERVGGVDLSGKYDPEKRQGQATFQVTGVSDKAVEPFLKPHLKGITLASMLLSATGSASYDAVGDTAAKAEIHVGNLLLDDASGALPRVPLNLEVKLDSVVRLPLATLRQFSLAVAVLGPDRKTFLPGGTVNASGQFDTEKGAGDATFAVEGLNQNTLAPFLASALAPNRLLSAVLDAQGTAKLDAQGNGTTTMSLSLTNLVTADAAGKRLEKPLAVSMHLEAGKAGTLVDLKNLALALAPTPRATNRIQLSGRLDLALTNASPSEFRLRSEGLDVTPYYDLFVGLPNTNGVAVASAPVPPAGPMEEPKAMSLPFQDFSLDARIDRFFLREVNVSNLVAGMKLKRGIVELAPLQMSLNGAPVKGAGTLNLGVTGWTYDVALTADRVPFEPVARSFFPQVITSIGNYDGRIVLDAKVQGAGVTGASLRRSLAGNVDFVFTNANLQAIKSEAKIWFIPINLRLIATFLGVPEIMQSPINTLNTKVTLGNGQIALREVNVLSDAFVAEMSGSIPIHEPLTESPLNLGVDLALRRSLAQKARLVPADAPPGDGFVRLPRLASVVGTIGKPETRTDKVALTLLTARTAGGLVGGKAGEAIQGAGNLLENVGGLFSGQKPNTNALPVTPGKVPSTNAPPRINPLDLLRRSLDRKP